jgi:hypothetical protein
MENIFSQSLICEPESRASAQGVELGVRLPWYRSLPVSVVEVAELSVDGRAVPVADIRFGINGKTFTLDQLPNLTGEVWFVLDSAIITARIALDPAVPHEVALHLNLYPPYIPGLTWVTRGRRTLGAVREAA